MTWPVASVLLGILGTIIVALLRWVGRRNGAYAPLAQMVDIQARLHALEQAHQQMRSELRGDLKDLERTVRDWIRKK